MTDKEQKDLFVSITESLSQLASQQGYYRSVTFTETSLSFRGGEEGFRKECKQ